MTTTPAPTNKSAWVQLYEARSTSVPPTRPPGRPPASVPRHKVGLTLSQGEIAELDVWQERLSHLLGRKVSNGEVVGVLTRICTARLGRLSDLPEGATLVDLVEWMVGQEK